MSKVLQATCQAGIVTIEGKPVEAIILSEGVKASEGVAVIQGDQVYYLTSSAEDVKDLISNIGSLIDLIVTSLTTLDGVTVAPGSAAASIALITAYKATLVAQGELLK